MSNEDSDGAVQGFVDRMVLGTTHKDTSLFIARKPRPPPLLYTFNEKFSSAMYANSN